MIIIMIIIKMWCICSMNSIQQQNKWYVNIYNNVCCWPKNKIDQWNRGVSREINPHIHNLHVTKRVFKCNEDNLILNKRSHIYTLN